MQKLVLRKFRCKGSGNDCPPFGFQVVRVKNVEGITPKMFLLGHDVEELQKDNIRIVVVK